MLFQAGGGRIAAGAALLALLEQTLRDGGEMRWESPVRALEIEDDRARVVTDARTYEAEVVVVAAGAWVGGLVGDVIGLPPLRVTQESLFHFAPVDPRSLWPSFIHHGEGLHYGLETPGEGVKVAEHGSGPAVTADERDFTVDPGSRERRRAVRRAVDARPASDAGHGGDVSLHLDAERGLRDRSRRAAARRVAVLGSRLQVRAARRPHDRRRRRRHRSDRPLLPHPPRLTQRTMENGRPELTTSLACRGEVVEEAEVDAGTGMFGDEISSAAGSRWGGRSGSRPTDPPRPATARRASRRTCTP